jgi:hypothetical protein
MKLLKGSLLIVLFGLFAFPGAFAQDALGTVAHDSLIMYSGKHYKGKIVDFNRNKALFHMQFQNGKKLKTKVFKTEDVFALYYKDSVSQVLYNPLFVDTENLDGEKPLTVEEMQSFVAGENLAQYRYHAPWSSAIGAVTGVGLFYLGIWGVAFPAVYVGVVAAMPTLPKAKKYFAPEKLNDELYVAGFKNVAKRKKLINAAIGSAASLLICGTITAILTFKNYND